MTKPGNGLVTEKCLPDGGLLVVHAHPDDETLSTGTLLATWAASGRPVTLVTCTRGERGEVIGAELAQLEGDGPALAAHRETELAAALVALGVTDHVYLDHLPPTPAEAGAVPAEASGSAGPREGASPAVRFEDSGMAWVGDGAAGTSGQAGASANLPPHALVGADLDDQAGRLAELLRVRRPTVVVTYEPGGGYGHPDHVRAHQLTMRALELAAHPSVHSPGHTPDRVWWPVIPPRTLRAARAALTDRGAWADQDAAAALERLLAEQPSAVLADPAGPLPAVAEPERPVVARLALSPVRHRVADALAAHRTQVHWITEISLVDGAAAVGRGGVDNPARDEPAAGLAGWYALSNDVLVPWLDHELYAVADSYGPPISADEQ